MSDVRLVPNGPLVPWKEFCAKYGHYIRSTGTCVCGKKGKYVKPY